MKCEFNSCARQYTPNQYDNLWHNSAVLTKPIITSKPLSNFLRTAASVLILFLIIGSSNLLYLTNDVANTLDQGPALMRLDDIIFDADADDTTTFPLGVDPLTKTITEQANVELYLQQYFAADYKRTRKVSWTDKLYEKVVYMPLYQSLASPSTRILVIFPGQRKEEIAMNFGRVLGWNKAERQTFMDMVTERPVSIEDGTFFPGRYVVSSDATPEVVAGQVQVNFARNVLAHYPQSIRQVVPVTDALTIASLIEREGTTFSDMQDISGVIWNRLFTGMKLQLDASLQYARGSRSYEPEWWPVPQSRDKFISSEYNTYLHKGLPPAPIANPSAAAIIAALNPTNSACMFYFHDDNGTMHCSRDYEEHKAKLIDLYGRGN